MEPTIRMEREPGIRRWEPFVRAFLCLPHLVWAVVLQGLSVLLSLVISVVVLINGRVPDRLARVQVLALRERVRAYGYFFLLRQSYPPFATAAVNEDPGDDPLVTVTAVPPSATSRGSVVLRPLTLLWHLLPLVPIALLLDLLYPVWMMLLAVRGAHSPWLVRLLLRTERWVGAVVLYVTFATDDRPAFGLSAYAQPGDPE